MQLIFWGTGRDPEEMGPTNEEAERIQMAIPNWEWNMGATEITAAGWNPLELMCLDPVMGICIVRFGLIRIVDPNVPFAQAEWTMTGDEVVLVGRFRNEGFVALAPE